MTDDSIFEGPLDWSDIEPVNRMRKDLRDAAERLSPRQARYFVDYYYQSQDQRIRAKNQTRAAVKDEEPNLLVDWVFQNFRIFEGDIRLALRTYAQSKALGRWAMSITGIGPVIAAGLLANIDITEAPTVGHIWNFAGLNPDREWLGREKSKELVKQVVTTLPLTDDMWIELAARSGWKVEWLRKSAMPTDKAGAITGDPPTRNSIERALAKRPWNASLKRLAFLAGSSFVKFKGHPHSFYGQFYEERRAYELKKNLNGDYAEQAARMLREKNYGRETPARAAYLQGQLPPGHLHMRALRYTAKLFLSHYHEVAYQLQYETPPPKPFAIEMLHHGHYIAPPNWPIAA